MKLAEKWDKSYFDPIYTLYIVNYSRFSKSSTISASTGGFYTTTYYVSYFSPSSRLVYTTESLNNYVLLDFGFKFFINFYKFSPFS